MYSMATRTTEIFFSHFYRLNSSSALGVTTERERKKLFGDTRNINFLHTDRILASESQPGEGGASVDPQRPAEVTGRSEEEKGSSHVPEKRDVAVLPSDEPETVEEVAEVISVSGVYIILWRLSHFDSLSIFLCIEHALQCKERASSFQHLISFFK